MVAPSLLPPPLCRAVLTSKSDPIGVWLVSATHQLPADPGSIGLANGQADTPTGMAHHQPELNMEDHNYGMPGIS